MFANDKFKMDGKRSGKMHKMKVSVVLSLITWHTTMLIFQICPIAHAEKKSNCMNLTIEVQPDKPVKSSVC